MRTPVKTVYLVFVGLVGTVYRTVYIYIYIYFCEAETMRLHVISCHVPLISCVYLYSSVYQVLCH
jgi:hypothetical protein